MKIAVNTRLLLKNKLEGIGWFSFEILKRITQNHPEHQFYFIFDRQYDASFIFSDNIIPIVTGPKTRHPVLWYLWLEHRIPKILKKLNVDLFLSPDGFLSLSTDIPQISVIHDINFVHNPKQLPMLVSKFYNYFFPKYSKIAKHIITVSEYSKFDICKSFDIPESKVTVCYNASNSIYSPIPDKEKEDIKKKYSFSEDYFIFIGALNPRKNIPGLLKSYEIFRNLGNYKQKLLIVGAAMHKTKEIEKTLKSMKFRNDVIFTGRLNSFDLHKVLASAFAMVYIPFFEGFGIPLVEAMYAETPIISGDTTSLPEVVGDAALISSPNNYIQIAKYMEDLTNNSELREKLIEKGRLQRRKFSWDCSAEKLWKTIEIVTNNKI
jgi:glycosyltransferase involved in cell wall biosynthesis